MDSLKIGAIAKAKPCSDRKSIAIDCVASPKGGLSFQ